MGTSENQTVEGAWKCACLQDFYGTIDAFVQRVDVSVFTSTTDAVATLGDGTCAM